MRKNNIELRKSTDNDGMFEIIKWYTNPYHKNEENNDLKKFSPNSPFIVGIIFSG